MVLKKENISYVVAPYEADAQMTFLAISKHVDAVITEDSDLIPFGCPRIIYKMDKFGQGVEFQYSKLQNNKELNLTGFTKQMILEMCILSGCDYLQSLPGMGLKKAHALIKKLKSYDKVIKHLKFSGIIVPPSYEECFRKAIMTFQHQRVYDPVGEDIVYLSNFSDNIDEDLDFLGPLIPQNLAKGIASGDINPFTKLPIQGECVKEGPLLDGTYNLKSFKPENANKKLDLPAQKNLVTNYFCFASLEAKRKFRAPRISPKQPNPTTEIPQTHSSEDFVDTIVPRKTSVLIELVSQDGMRGVEHSKQTIHPCIASQKESEPNSPLHASEGKTRVQKKPTVVRSRYFQHKNSEEISEVNTASNNTTSSGDPVLVSGQVEVKARVENMKIHQSRYFQLKSSEEINEVNSTSKNATSSCDPLPVSGLLEVKARVENMKMHQSRYFQNRNSEENNEVNTASKNSASSCDPVSVLGSVEVKARVENMKLNKSCYFTYKNQENTNESHSETNNGLTMKRKFSIVDDSVQKDNLSQKYMRSGQSPANQGGCNSDLDDQMQVTSDEEKFGCNISHLGKYSEIAEKSMEKFMSVISSFKFTSTGSRASGLRAPLKDVRNTFTKKTSPIDDISKFAYTPTKPLPLQSPSPSRRP